jgi:hypothetical protein
MDLRVQDALVAAVLEVAPGEVVEVLLRPQHRHREIVEVEEALEVLELVGPPHLLDRPVGKLDAVPLREGEHELGLEGALDVEVELGLGECGEEGGGWLGRACCLLHGRPRLCCAQSPVGHGAGSRSSSCAATRRPGVRRCPLDPAMIVRPLCDSEGWRLDIMSNLTYIFNVQRP